jgi:glycosyltransferase involved in cell wall biosynthesis
MVPATDFTTKVYKEDCGQWSEPNEEDLIEKMRWCYNNQDEVKKMGKYAAEYVKENWTWDKKIDMFTQALDKHL